MLSESEGSTTPDEFPPSAGSECDSEETVVESNQNESSTTLQIKLLRKMCSEGHISKKDLAKMIMQILSKPVVVEKPATSNKRSRGENEEARGFANQVLRSRKRFRRRASPETVKIRKIIEGPIERRFQLECTKRDSSLFGKVPPKRLREDLFELACKAPLEEIYTSNAKDLKDVANNKVMHIIKWKIRKMRANPLPVKHHMNDKFDFDKEAKELDKKLFSAGALERRRDYHYTSKTSRYFHIHITTKHIIIIMIAFLSLPYACRTSSTTSCRNGKQKVKTSTSSVVRSRSAFTSVSGRDNSYVPSFGSGNDDVCETPPRADNTNPSFKTYRKCAKCAKRLCFNDCFPADIDWSVNDVATPYCHEHWVEKKKQMDLLAGQPGSKKKKPNKRGNQRQRQVNSLPTP